MSNVFCRITGTIGFGIGLGVFFGSLLTLDVPYMLASISVAMLGVIVIMLADRVEVEK